MKCRPPSRTTTQLHDDVVLAVAIADAYRVAFPDLPFTATHHQMLMEALRKGRESERQYIDARLTTEGLAETLHRFLIRSDLVR